MLEPELYPSLDDLQIMLVVLTISYTGTRGSGDGRGELHDP